MLNLRLNSYSVSLFSLEEFREAFIRTAKTDVTPQGDEPSLPLPSLKVVLDVVFHGPVPPLELTRVTAALEAGLAQRGTDTLSLSDFLLVIEDLQHQPLEVNEDNYAHYRSFNQLRAHKLRQVRPFHGPEETLRAPMTMLQDVGFEAKAFKPQPRFVKNHCEETKFKGEMIKVSSRAVTAWRLFLLPCSHLSLLKIAYKHAPLFPLPTPPFLVTGWGLLLVRGKQGAAICHRFIFTGNLYFYPPIKPFFYQTHAHTHKTYKQN